MAIHQQQRVEQGNVNITHSLRFLRDLVQQRLQATFAKENETATFVIPEPFLAPDESPYYQFLHQQTLSLEEYVIFLLALVPHVQPNFFESILQAYLPNGGDFIEIGGVKGVNHRGMLPTGETAIFILGGTDVAERLAAQHRLLDSRLLQHGILSLEPVRNGEPIMSGRLLMAQEWLDKILFGREAAVQFSTDFPAKKITTQMNWDDLILNKYTRSQLDDLMLWVQHQESVMQYPTLQRKLKPGYRVLFYGPSGTGKTMTAMLLGNHFGKEVYRIDLSQVVSKYIGETEKNLERVFAKAANKNWILFFDEADALFGKRTNVQNAHDRYANQEVSYLLQRVEDYPGLIILASNFKTNLDDAFIRRFNSMIHFPAPNASERLRLWQKTVPAEFQPEPGIHFQTLAEKYELTGAVILNVIQYATLRSVSRGETTLRYEELMEGIRKEFRKEERSTP